MKNKAKSIMLTKKRKEKKGRWMFLEDTQEKDRWENMVDRKQIRDYFCSLVTFLNLSNLGQN